jgi:predicted nucleic acid-binding protein
LAREFLEIQSSIRENSEQSGSTVMKVALDTNFLIDFIEGVQPQADKVEALIESFVTTENEGIISTINVAEVLSGFYVTDRIKEGDRVKQLLNDLTIASFRIVPVTFEIADLAARLRSKIGGELPDALIAATAISEGCSILYSRDKHFRRFQKDIKVCESL